MSITKAFLDELRDRIRLSDIIGRRVQWDRTRSNPSRQDYWAPCPFHQEKTASFHVDDRKGYYYCFGCHAKGDAVSFLMEAERMDFPEAVEALAEEAGLPMPKRDPQAQEKADRNEMLRKAHSVAAAFFQRQLHHSVGRDALDYARHKRGLSDATLKAFEVGFAPSARQGLISHLSDHGLSADIAVEAGLAIRPEAGGSPFDRFRDRLMFPIHDGRGRIIAFGGRAMSAEAKAKYLNSPETPLFSKGRALFNHHRALKVRDDTETAQARLVVVEGYMDVIALYQAGFERVVAPNGTALTEAQAELLWRMSAQPVLCFDGDAAGDRAAWRAFERLAGELGPERSLRFAFPPAGQDPDDVVREGGAKAFEAVIQTGEDVSALIWRQVSRNVDLSSAEGRAGLKPSLMQAIEPLSPALAQEVKADLLARADEALEAARPARRRWGGTFQQPAPVKAAPTPELIQQLAQGRGHIPMRLLLAGGVRLPHMVEAHLEALASLPISNEHLSKVRSHMLDLAHAHEGEDLAEAMGKDDVVTAVLEHPVVQTVGWLRPDAQPQEAERAWLELLKQHVEHHGRQQQRKEFAQQWQDRG